MTKEVIPPAQLPNGGRLSARRGPDGRYLPDPDWWERMAVARATDSTTTAQPDAPNPRSEHLPLIGTRRAIRHAEGIRERAWTAVVRRLAELSAKGTDIATLHTLRASYMATFNRFPAANWWLTLGIDQQQHNHDGEIRAPETETREAEVPST